MSDHSPTFIDAKRKRWTNWHENFSNSIDQLLDIWNCEPEHSTIANYNGTSRGIQALAGRAIAENKTLRALGGGWSLSPIATASGILLNTRPLNYRFRLKHDHMHAAFNGKVDDLAFVQCGTSVADINKYLRGRGKSLRSCGASNGQTIVGALSTGTHGSALDEGAINDQVVAMHIITGPDTSVWLERASRPVTKDSLAAALGAELKRDDDLFNAAVVSFGNFGIIHSVVLEETDLFYLQAYRVKRPLDEGMWKAIDQLDFSNINLPKGPGRRPFYFQVVINPFDTDGGVFTTVMYKDDLKDPSCAPLESGGKIVEGDGAAEIISVITDTVSEVTSDVTKLLVNSFYPEYQGRCGTLGEVFTDTTTRGRVLSAAMGIPLGQARRAVEICLKEVKRFEAPVVLATRYARQTQATLGFTKFGPQTCILEIDGPQSRRVKSLYNRIWKALDKAGIDYTFHWGKINNLNATNVRRLYGEENVKAWIKARREILPTREQRAIFSNGFIDELNMSD